MITLLTYSTQNTTLGSRVLKNREIKVSITRFKIQNRNKDPKWAKVVATPNPDSVTLGLSPSVCFPRVDYSIGPLQLLSAPVLQSLPLKYRLTYGAHKNGWGGETMTKNKTTPLPNKDLPRRIQPVSKTEWVSWWGCFFTPSKNSKILISSVSFQTLWTPINTSFLDRSVRKVFLEEYEVAVTIA